MRSNYEGRGRNENSLFERSLSLYNNWRYFYRRRKHYINRRKTVRGENYLLEIFGNLYESSYILYAFCTYLFKKLEISCGSELPLEALFYLKEKDLSGLSERQWTKQFIRKTMTYKRKHGLKRWAEEDRASSHQHSNKPRVRWPHWLQVHWAIHILRRLCSYTENKHKIRHFSTLQIWRSQWFSFLKHIALTRGKNCIQVILQPSNLLISYQHRGIGI